MTTTTECALLLTGLSLLLATVGALGISRLHRTRSRLGHEHTHCAAASSPDRETPATLSTSSASSPPAPPTPIPTAHRDDMSHAPTPAAASAILQSVLDALYHFTGLPLLMVPQTDPSALTSRLSQALALAPTETERMRADKKNAELTPATPTFRRRSSTVSEVCPEDLSSASEPESDSDDDLDDSTAPTTSPAPPSNGLEQCQLLDGLDFFLALSQVRARTVESVLELGVAKAMASLHERQQTYSISVISERYPDFTCLPMPTPAPTPAPTPTARGSAVRQMPCATQKLEKQPHMDLLSALRLPSAASMARGCPQLKLEAKEDGELGVRRASALSSPRPGAAGKDTASSMRAA